MLGAEVEAGPNVRYAVFEGMDKPGKACVVINYGNEEASARVSWTGRDGRRVEIPKPFYPDVRDNPPGTIHLPSRTCGYRRDIKSARAAPLQVDLPEQARPDVRSTAT